MPSTLEGYTIGRTLGSGFSAKVKHATDQQGNQYALKIFRHDNPKFNQRQFTLLKNEVQQTSTFDHPNVVKYHTFGEQVTWSKNKGDVLVSYIAQELISGGELFDYVANSGAFSESVCKYYFKQMLHGLNYIHSQGFAHRDLKPENILLDSQYNVKLVDFGFVKDLAGADNSGFMHSRVGTPGYMAPEILSRKAYQGQQVDLFALGVILFILYTGHPPFMSADENDKYYRMLMINRADQFWLYHSQDRADGFFSEEFKDLI